jgi:hypothetical protein
MLRGKTKQIMLINIALSICILSILYLNFCKRRVVIDVNKGSEPKNLLEILDSNNLHFKKKFQLIFTYNTRPTLSSLENIDKLYHIYEKEDVDICAIFSTHFRPNREFHVPHRFLVRRKLILLSSFETASKQPYFLLMNGNKVVFADHILELLQLTKILEWKLHPDSKDHIQLSREDLRSVLLARLNREQLNLLDIYTKDIRPLESVISTDTDEIYIIHATCAGCELNKVIINIGEIRRKKPIIILSVHANSYEIEAVLRSQNKKPSVFIDYRDGLGLLHTDVEEKYSLFAFARREIRW